MTTNTAINTSEGAILEALNGKLDLDTGNISENGKETLTGYGFPSSKYIELTLGASGSSYTAPANGYFAFYSENIENSILYGVNKPYGQTALGASGYVNFNTLPVMKGDVISVTYGPAPGFLKFIYAEGTDNE